MTRVSEHELHILKDLDEPVPNCLHLSSFVTARTHRSHRLKGQKKSWPKWEMEVPVVLCAPCLIPRTAHPPSLITGPGCPMGLTLWPCEVISVQNYFCSEFMVCTFRRFLNCL